MTSELLLTAVARILIGGLFVLAGVRHRNQVAIMASMLTSKGIPLARLSVILAIATQIVAGVLLMLGVQTRIASVVLIVFSLAASVLFVNFWNMEGPKRAQTAMIFQLNMACVGGLILLAIG